MRGTGACPKRSVAMPTFYFHVCDGSTFAEADEGIELADVEAARRQAVLGLRDILAGDVCRGEMNLAAFVEVEDENRQLLFTVTVEDAVQVKNEAGTRPRGRS